MTDSTNSSEIKNQLFNDNGNKSNNNLLLKNDYQMKFSSNRSEEMNELTDKQSTDDHLDKVDSKLARKSQNSANDFTEPFDETIVEQRNERKRAIERSLHNQKTYYDQKNNVDSDNSDLQSNVSSTKSSTLDVKMREMIKMFIESFVPFNLIHGSHFSNLLRNSFNIRKMPKLVQMRDLFDIIYEISHKYICQTVGGAQSYTLLFEFWKSANRRHQYVTVRASYIDVFVQRTPVLTCFKVYHDWTSEKYIERFNYLFKRYNLDRTKVFACVTNFRARNFLDALDMYGISSEKIIFCLISQLNNKFNEILLNCDYEEDRIHYEEKLKEIPCEEIPCEETSENQQDNNLDDNCNSDDSSSENNFSDDFSDEDEQNLENEEKSEENFEPTNIDQDDLEIRELIGKIDANGEKIEDEEEDDDEVIDVGEDGLVYIKLIEEPKDVFKILNKKKCDEKVPPNVRVVKELIKTFAFISSDQALLDELNKSTSKKNGHEFYLFYLLAYKNWNFLHKLLFYFKMVKDDFIEFLTKHPEVPFELNDNDFEIIDDIFEILAYLLRKTNELSLEENIGLGKALNIMKYFVNSLPKLNLKTKEGQQLRDLFLSFFKSKHGVFERCNYYGVASLLDPKATKYDFKTDQTFKNALRKLHDILCFKLDKNFNLALYKIRAPLRIEIESFHKRRPYTGINDLIKFQLNSPVLQNLVYDYFTLSAICFEPKKIDYDVRDKIIQCLSEIRSDVLSKVLILNSLDNDVFERIIDHAKFW